MTNTDPRIDAYIAKAKPFAQPILKRIRKAVHAGCPDVTETIKWSVPAFDYKGPLCGMAAFKAHCLWGFWKAPLMKSIPKDVKKDEGMGGFGRFESIDDLPDEKTIVRMVKEAAALNDAGTKLPRTTKAKAPLKAPAYMLAAIKKNKKAQQAFEAFSPSHKREYVEWITEAKSDETRDRRLATAVQWMAEGKSRNWKYIPTARTAKRVAVALLLAIALASPASAQTPPAAVSANPISDAIRGQWNGVKRNIQQSADLMSAENYEYRPVDGVRTFGEILAHVAGANYVICAAAKTEKTPFSEDHFEKAATTRPAIIKATADAIAYCDAVYAALTDATAGQAVPSPFGPTQTTRANVLVLNIAHGNEHYGNLVTYLRMNGIVPPSSRRR
jgi:uncharacterized damage-inducible protein DinB